MKWLYAVSHPYFGFFFPAAWEEEMKERVANWFAIKFVQEGKPTPFTWRASNYVSPDNTAWVEVKERATYSIDYGGMCIADEPCIEVPINALNLTLAMRCGTAEGLLSSVQRRLSRPPRRKYGHEFYDLASWPGCVWTLTPGQLESVEASLRGHEPAATAQFEAFMHQWKNKTP